MRYLNFKGLMPKLKPQGLPNEYGVLAENLDIGRGTLRGFRAPGHVGQVVHADGTPMTNDFPATLHKAGGMWVGFDDPTHIAPDTAVGAADESFLFVSGSKLYWQSPEGLTQRRSAVPVGVCSPEAPAAALVLAGDGCDEVAPGLPCVTPAAAPGTPCLPATPELRGYVYTFVRVYPGCAGREEESAPSPPVFVEALPGDGVVLTAPTLPAGVTGVRWYRSVPTSDGRVVWLLAGVSDTAMHVDRACVGALAEPLQTEGHMPPPECVDGVAVVGDALTVLWSGRRIYVSVPFKPHAYILARDEFEVTADIVAIRGLVGRLEQAHTYEAHILTKGYPYRMTGGLQEKVEIRQVQANHPCLGGVCAVLGATGYASPYGFVIFDGERAENVTAPWMTTAEWGQFMLHGRLAAAYWDERLWLFRPGNGGLVVTLALESKQREPAMVTHTVQAGAAAVPEGEQLHVAGRGGTVLLWGAGAPMRWRWRAADEVMATVWRPAAFKVVSDVSWHWRDIDEAALAFAEWQRVRGQGTVGAFVQAHPQFTHLQAQLERQVCHEVRVLRDGHTVHTTTAHDARPLRLPRWPRATEWAIEVSGYREVREVHLQTSITDLAQDGGHA